MRFVDNKFLQQKVQLDGNEFIRCRFESVILVYSAQAPVSMVDCTFENNVTWTFDGSAALTLAFLKALYHGTGEGGKQLVEKTFENIQRLPTNIFSDSVPSGD